MRSVTLSALRDAHGVEGDFFVACPQRCPPPEDGEDLDAWREAVAASPHGLVIDPRRRVFAAWGDLECLEVRFLDAAEGEAVASGGPPIVDALTVDLSGGRAQCGFVDEVGIYGGIETVAPGLYRGAIYDRTAGRRHDVEAEVRRRTAAAARTARRIAGGLAPALAVATPAVVWLWVRTLEVGWVWLLLVTVALTAGNWALQLAGWARLFRALGVDEARDAAELVVPQAQLVLRRVDQSPLAGAWSRSSGSV